MRTLIASLFCSHRNISAIPPGTRLTLPRFSSSLQ
jgi:hypothetical protein